MLTASSELRPPPHLPICLSGPLALAPCVGGGTVCSSARGFASRPRLGHSECWASPLSAQCLPSNCHIFYCRSHSSLFSKPGINESYSHPPSPATCFIFACLYLWFLKLQNRLVIILATFPSWPWSPRLRCLSYQWVLILPRPTSVHVSLCPNMSDAWHPEGWTDRAMEASSDLLRTLRGPPLVCLEALKPAPPYLSQEVVIKFLNPTSQS